MTLPGDIVQQRAEFSPQYGVAEGGLRQFADLARDFGQPPQAAVDLAVDRHVLGMIEERLRHAASASPPLCEHTGRQLRQICQHQIRHDVRVVGAGCQAQAALVAGEQGRPEPDTGRGDHVLVEIVPHIDGCAGRDAPARQRLAGSQVHAETWLGSDKPIGIELQLRIESQFLERLVEDARHIEVQVLGDSHGRVIHLGERECSIQRRHQKVIEESPSRALAEDQRRQICEAAVSIVQAVGYVGAGTVEFLLGNDGHFFFLEVNPRLQVEHTVTEAVTGVDIVKEQIRIASGRELRYAQGDVQFRGAAVECRILAEDPSKGYIPAVGQISRLVEPGGAGIRVDSGVCEGLSVTPYYDSLLAKLLAWGETRAVAIVRMRRALEEYRVIGVQTNLDLHRAILNAHWFQSGKFHTRYLEDEFLLPEPGGSDRLAAALVAALLDHRRRGRSDAVRGGTDSRWKLLGRWDMMRSCGL
mgnify:CR=1 FL=1